ncbi:MAG: saccharopine dehydrogenase [Planctomycetota bacterium]|nr:MAG: saccharopine dehydrogenase [Planctomycetota bacterium]
MGDGRDFDLVLQGATGFTGRRAAAELAGVAPPGFRWAVAGRDRARVEALAAAHGVDAVVADGLDPAAVDRLAARARVVISCAGPFSRYGDALVAACARHHSHYADLTGELPWIRQLVDRHHQACTASGTALIPASGFDSVPSDLGVMALVESLPEAAAVTGFVQLRGGLNGGTLASGIHLHERWRPADFAHPHLLDPDPDAGLRRAPAAPERPPVFPVPALHGWAAPFLMAPVNERVVRRSAALRAEGGAGYGRGFRYDEHLLLHGRGRARFMALALRTVEGLLQRPAGRRLLRWLGPRPGRGPSERSIRRGFARLTLVAGDLRRPVAVRRWHWHGDPGNAITVRCLVQTGLALAAGEAARGGVLTPAAALGRRLLDRLAAAGAVTEIPADR